MKTLIDVWNPKRLSVWQEFNALQKKMDYLFDSFISDMPAAERKGSDFVPACDLEETDKGYLISVDVPGMTKEQLQVEISGNTLTVSGEQKEEKTDETAGRHSFERYHGRFERSFTLPNISEGMKIEADYKDGVLRIAVPKGPEAKAKTRKIQIGDGKLASTQKISRSEEEKERKLAEKAA